MKHPRVLKDTDLPPAYIKLKIIKAFLYTKESLSLGCRAIIELTVPYVIPIFITFSRYITKHKLKMRQPTFLNTCFRFTQLNCILSVTPASALSPVANLRPDKRKLLPADLKFILRGSILSFFSYNQRFDEPSKSASESSFGNSAIDCDILISCTGFLAVLVAFSLFESTYLTISSILTSSTSISLISSSSSSSGINTYYLDLTVSQ